MAAQREGVPQDEEDFDLKELLELDVDELLSRFPSVPGENSDSPELEEQKYSAVMQRACKGARVIGTREQQDLFRWMISVGPARAQAVQRQAQDIVNNQGQIAGKSLFARVLGNDNPVVEVSKYHLDFGLRDGDLLPLGRPRFDRVSITSKCKSKVTCTIEQPPQNSMFSLTAEPLAFVLKKKGGSCEIEFRILVKTSVNIEQVIIMEIEGGTRHFFTVRLAPEPSVFGSALESLDFIEDQGYVVPRVLVLLRKAFVDTDARCMKDVFRAGAEDAAVQNARDALNRGTLVGCRDPAVPAHLIKMWFRELPQNVLNYLPTDRFPDACDTEAGSLSMLPLLPDRPRALLDWLVVLLADVAREETRNGMGIRNLAVLFAPNLYNMPPTDPMRSVGLSQRVVTFLAFVLNNAVKRSSA